MVYILCFYVGTLVLDSPVPGHYRLLTCAVLICFRINMKVKDGEIIAIVGHVGSGKSSLMAACLGELERLKGSVTIRVGL